MTARLIDGRALAQLKKQALAEKIRALRPSADRSPCLAVILVGDDPASHIYVSSKEKACTEIGIQSLSIRLPAKVSEEELLDQVRELNADSKVDGILVQLPLPQHINRWHVITTLAPHKDVDGLSPVNQGLMMWDKQGLYSCTPLGIMELIESTGVSFEGAHAAVIGRSVLVGGPTAVLLGNRGATVTSMHSKSRDIPASSREADILVVATGVHHLVKREWVKPGAVVIDVGIHRIGGKIAGDVDFAEVSKVAGYITPVPGGVGPMTIAMLLSNCVQAYGHNLSIQRAKHQR
jgi:methylenetetrahydrofolate dehydrogenase (NADP+)/methenyltetrahydrofolate cyclohydrolase